MNFRNIKALAAAAVLSVSLSQIAGAEQPPTSSNVAVAQCNVVREMMKSVPMWRDNGVPVERAAMNVAGALAVFAPDPSTSQEWIGAVRKVYSSGVNSTEIRIRYQALCEPYQRMTIPAPKPR